MSAVELSRFILHGFVGKYDLPKKFITNRKYAIIQKLNSTKKLEDQKIRAQLELIVYTRPNTVFQMFKKLDRNTLAADSLKFG
jgi:hypothetical protein